MRNDHEVGHMVENRYSDLRGRVKARPMVTAVTECGVDVDPESFLALPLLINLIYMKNSLSVLLLYN